MQSSSHQSSATAVPLGPSTSTSRNSKLDQIIQNFYTKAAQIIVQARCTPNNDSRYGKRSSLKGSSSLTNGRKMNKWFNIATEDVEVLREDLKFWRNIAVQSTDKEPPPMIVDIYLDTSKLSHNQSLVVADDNLRWTNVNLKSHTSDVQMSRILIESWELTLKHPLPDFAVDLPNLYKRSIVFFRALHSYVRLLPGYDLYRKLHKLKNDSNPLSIGYRLSSSSNAIHAGEIPIGSTILENDARKPTKTYDFSDIVTPLGTFKLNVTYRRNCDFEVEDVERDLSAQFIDMDEQFFTPTMAKYQQEYTSKRPVSMYNTSSSHSSPRKELSIAKQPQLQRQQQFSPSTSPRHPSDPKEIRPRPTTSSSSARHLQQRDQQQQSPAGYQQSSYGSRRESADSTANRRASAPYVVSPFKSPFLSSSPQAESIFSGAGSGGSQRHYTPPSSERSMRGGTTGVDSGSFGRKIEFSSSFDKYRSASPTSTSRPSAGESPSGATGSSIMMRRWSRQSGDRSTIQTDDDDDLEDFVRFVGSNQELRLFQQQRGSQMFSSSSASTTTSGGGDDASLSHFQNLRETHNSLSESLSSSMMIQQQSSQQVQQPNSPVSSSTTSSQGARSYQPIIPSPLHHTAKDQQPRSTSPVHIPRSLPQIRSLAAQNNALRITRIYQRGNSGRCGNREEEDDQEEDDHDGTEGYNDMSAFATYPQVHHHDLHSMLRNTAAATTGNSQRVTGRAINAPLLRSKSPTQQHYGNGMHEEDTARGGSSLIYRSREGGGSSLMMQDNNSSTTTSAQGGVGRSHSMMDDDDSLVFKMSELECDSSTSSHLQQQQRQSQQQQQQPQQMLFSNNRYITQRQSDNNVTTSTNNNNRPNTITGGEHFLELTPTPLSPPLLHRLQAISMSTVAEEEEKSSSAATSSGTSSNRESPTRLAATSKPSNQPPPPFDAW